MSVVLVGNTVVQLPVLRPLQYPSWHPMLDCLSNPDVHSVFYQTTSPAAINALATSLIGVTSVVSITIVSSAITTTQLTALLANVTTVTGDISMVSLSTITSVSMPLLQTVGGGLNLNTLQQATTVFFGSLRTVGGSLTIRSMRALSGSAISTGLRQLTVITGQLSIWSASQQGSSARLELGLPQLRSVGSMYIREINCGTISASILTTVAGGSVASGVVTFINLARTTTLDFPSLVRVSGRISFLNLALLSNLCEIGLPATGYTDSRAVSNPLLPSYSPSREHAHKLTNFSYHRSKSSHVRTCW
jgi:hypothetical protein